MNPAPDPSREATARRLAAAIAAPVDAERDDTEWAWALARTGEAAPPPMNVTETTKLH